MFYGRRDHGKLVSSHHHHHDGERKRKAVSIDANTKQRARAVVKEIQEDYAQKVMELAHAYQVVLDKTKNDCWKRLAEQVGGGLLEALGIRFDTFFVSGPPTGIDGDDGDDNIRARTNGFSLLPRPTKRPKRTGNGRFYPTSSSSSSSADEADDEREDMAGFEGAYTKGDVLSQLKQSPNGVIMQLIEGNQYTTAGGRSACTAIAFAATYRMSLVHNVKTLESRVDWGRVLELGTELWTMWKNSDAGASSQRRFISVEDLRTMPSTKQIFGKVWETLDNTDTEKVGYIDDEVNKGLGGEKFCAMNLRDALSSMRRTDPSSKSSSVAVICGGTYGGSNSSLALWRDVDGHYAMYNSHGGQVQGNSTLYVMRNLGSALACIRGVLSHMPTTTLEKPVAGKSKSVMYSMHILRFELTNKNR